MLDTPANSYDNSFMTNKSLIFFIMIVLGISGAITYTTPYLISHTTIGLEFKGGYEILYTAESLQSGKPVDKDTLLNISNILASRANSLGVSEPQVA